MMKNVLLATAMTTCLASTAFAGVLEYTPVSEPEMVAPAVTDWSGPYAGVLYAMGSATQNYVHDFGEGTETWSRPDLEGTMYGAFAGYNIQRGSYVFGVEGAYSIGSFAYGEGEPGYEWGEELTSVIDIKARAGFAAGGALIYGFAGWSMGDFRIYDELIYDETFSVDGMNYGVGADFLITDSIFVGAEYIVRELSGATWPDETVDLGVEAIQLRIGMQF